MPLLALLAVLAGAPLSEPLPGPAPRNQHSARAVSNGDDYLVLWTDQRSFPPATYATRVTAEGEVLDRTGIRITDDGMYAHTMIWSGTSYVIAWTKGDDVWLVRVDRDGAIVDGPRVVLDHAYHSTMAFDGTHVVLGYSRGNGTNFEPHALFLTPEAEVVKDVTLAEGGEYGPPVLAWNGSHFAAVWLTVSDFNTVRSVDGVRFTIDGPGGPVTRLLHDAKQYGPRLVSDGRDFLLLMYDDNVFRHFARPVSADLTAVGSAVMLPAALRGSAVPVWVGNHYVVMGESGSRISAVRLDRQGRLLDAEAKVIQGVTPIGSEAGAFVATNGRDLLVTWSGVQYSPEENSEPLDIYGATVSGSTLERTSTAMLSLAAPRQSDPAVASNGFNLLTVWHEGAALYARRTAPNGRPRDPSPIRLADRAQTVSATFDGTDYIVAWSGPGELVTRRIPAHGPLVANGGTRIPLQQAVPLALASNGEVTLLAWASREGVKAVRLGADATFVDSVPLVLTSDGTISALSVAAGGDAFLVAWGNTYFTEHGGMNPVNVLGARVTNGLTNLDAGGFEIAATAVGEGYPSVAWNGGEWLVVWERANEIRGRRIAPTGALLDGPASDAGVLIAASAKRPVLAWSGSYTLAWIEPRPYPGPDQLRAARFARLGSPLTGLASLGEIEAFSRRSAFLTAAGGSIVIAYARIAREPEAGGVMRAFVSTLDAPRRRATRH